MTDPVRVAWRGAVPALASALALAFLPGCATAPAPASGAAPLAGRLAVQVQGQPERSMSADFELSGDAEQGSLLLSGPLGAGAVQARWQPGEAVLLQGGQSTRHADLDSLARSALGEPLPMAALFDWLRGRPWAGAPWQARADGQPGFSQLGWGVNLARWPDGLLEAVNPQPPVVTVRARLEPRP